MFIRIILIFFCFRIQAQFIKLPNKAVLDQYSFIITQEKNFDQDTIALKNFLNPLLQKQNASNLIIYNNLLANGYATYFDSITNKSSVLYLQAISLAKNQNNKSLEIWSTLNYVKYLYTYRKFEAMLPHFISLLTNVKTTADDLIITPSETYKTIGWIMQTLKDYSESEYYINRALLHTSNNTLEYAALLDCSGINLHKTGKMKLALSQFEKAGNLALKLKDTLRYAKSLGNTALIYNDLNDTKKAILLLKTDIDLSEKIKNDKNSLFATKMLSQLYLDTNDIENATYYLNKGLKIAISKPYFRKDELELTKLKIALLSKNPDPNKELLLHRRLLLLEDSLKNNDGDTAIKGINWQLQKENYKNEIVVANNQIDSEVKSKRIFIYSTIGIFIITLCVFYNELKKWYKEKKSYNNKVSLLELEKVEVEKNLEFTSKNLRNHKDYLQSKNSQIKNLKVEIETIKTSPSSYLEKKSGKLQALLQSHLMTPANWKAFKIQFELENDVFCNNLHKKFPELADSNLRIVYLQKLGFENHEIANFLGVSADAIKKSNQRLKKKLGDKYELFFKYITKK